MRILVVDNARMTRTKLCRQLTELGYDVAWTEAGSKALTLVQEEAFDIVLVDYETSDMEGVEVCWHLRSTQGVKHLYLMLMLSDDVTDQFFEIVENGADEFLKKPLDVAWLRARLLAASRVVDMQHQLEILAATDFLTGAMNRGRFMTCAGEEMARARRYEQDLCLLMLDIDFFKKINDTYGHASGDEAIRSLVRTCRSLIRPYDILGRLGGEEFAILLPVTSLTSGVVVAERLRRSLAEAEVKGIGGVSIKFTVSIGVSMLHPSDSAVDAVLQRADEALYLAKRSGRNRVEVEGSVSAEVA